MQIIYFDTETSGLNPITDELLQIAFYVNDELFWSETIKNEKEVTNFEFHGLKQEDLDKSRSLKDVMLSCIEWLSNLPDKQQLLLIAHNAQFDLKFLSTALKKCDLNLPKNILVSDSLRAYRFYETGKCSLEFLHKKYCNNEEKQKHEALSDCIMLKDTIKASSNHIFDKIIKDAYPIS
jgi:DNA polymerase III epsilon subunit-like protein